MARPGIKTAQALAGRGYDVTLVARKSQVLSNLLDDAAAALLHQAMTGAGVKLRFHAIPAALSGERGRVKSVVLTDGSEIPADLVIIGIGVIPNTEFLSEAGLNNPSGLQIDQQLRTPREDIYAAGDSAFSPLIAYPGKKPTLPSGRPQWNRAAWPGPIWPARPDIMAGFYLRTPYMSGTPGLLPAAWSDRRLTTVKYISTMTLPTVIIAGW